MTLPVTSALCGIFTFLLAGSPIFYSPTPRGTCSNCCEIKERYDIKFMLYTRKNPFKFQYLYMNNEKRLRKSNFNFNYPLAIYLHGFSESATGERQSSQEIKDAFLKGGNYNVVLIDWSPMTAVPWYSSAVENFPVAAKYVARFIYFLLQQGYQVQKLHLIGFSLGAEVAGFVGKQLKEWGIYLPRITGLDPALPLFENGSSYRSLSPKDARFVDIIHTDGGILGNPEAMGHADFYPNGGQALQPGCARQEIANNRWLGILIGCSHQRAWEYFIESICQPFAFPANRCEPSKLFGTCRNGNGKAFMGMGADKRLRGKFFLDTNDKPPYGRNYLGATTAARDRNKFKKTSAAYILSPSVQTHIEQQLDVEQKEQYEQQIDNNNSNNNNLTTEYIQENDTLMDVAAETMIAAIKRQGVEEDLAITTEIATTIATISNKLPTADGWNSVTVSSRSKTKIET